MKFRALIDHNGNLRAYETVPSNNGKFLLRADLDSETGQYAAPKVSGYITDRADDLLAETESIGFIHCGELALPLRVANAIGITMERLKVPLQTLLPQLAHLIVLGAYPRISSSNLATLVALANHVRSKRGLSLLTARRPALQRVRLLADPQALPAPYDF